MCAICSPPRTLSFFNSSTDNFCSSSSGSLATDGGIAMSAFCWVHEQGGCCRWECDMMLLVSMLRVPNPANGAAGESMGACDQLYSRMYGAKSKGTSAGSLSHAFKLHVV